MEQIITLAYQLPDMHATANTGAISLEWGIAIIIVVLGIMVTVVAAMLRYIVTTTVKQIQTQMNEFNTSIKQLTQELKETNLELARMVQASLAVKHDVDDLKDRVTEVEIVAEDVKERVIVLETKAGGRRRASHNTAS